MNSLSKLQMSLAQDGKRTRGVSDGRRRRDYYTNKKRKQRLSPDDTLNDQLEELFQDIILPDEMIDIRREVMKRVEEVLNSNFSEYLFKARVYGSTEYGLCLKDGDLDICCTSFSGMQVNSLALEAFAECFRNNNFEVKDVIGTAKVPIIKMVDLETTVNIDLSFNQPTAHIHVEYFSTIINCNRHFRKVAVLLKYWLKIRNLNCPFKGGLSSAAFCFMIIHYFTTFDPPLFPKDFNCYILPTLQFKIMASRLPPHITSQHTTASLIKGFFEYYKNYDWEEPIKANLFELPNEFFSIPAVMTVLDPISNLNCTKSVSLDGLKVFKMEVTRANKILNEANDFNKLLEKPVPFPE